jgi:hypothetical protein
MFYGIKYLIKHAILMGRLKKRKHDYGEKTWPIISTRTSFLFIVVVVRYLKYEEFSNYFLQIYTVCLYYSLLVSCPAHVHSFLYFNN